MRTRELLARVRERKSVLLEEGQRLAAKVEELTQLETQLTAPEKGKAKKASKRLDVAKAAFAANAEPTP